VVKAAGVFESLLTSCHIKLFISELLFHFSFTAVQEFRNIQELVINCQNMFNPHISKHLLQNKQLGLGTKPVGFSSNACVLYWEVSGLNFDCGTGSSFVWFSSIPSGRWEVSTLN
jgi:hypothetical protein